uniref:Uncharacterized protein n=1 Tax=Pinctada fucata TaxID=50426 RepID=A0A194ALN6_PINFU
MKRPSDQPLQSFSTVLVTDGRECIQKTTNSPFRKKLSFPCHHKYPPEVAIRIREVTSKRSCSEKQMFIG